MDGNGLYSDKKQSELQSEQSRMLESFNTETAKYEEDDEKKEIDKLGQEALRSEMNNYQDAENYEFDWMEISDDEILSEEERKNKQKWIDANKEKRWTAYYQKDEAIRENEEIVKKSTGFWIFRTRTTKRAESELKRLKKQKRNKLRVYQQAGLDMSNDMLKFYGKRIAAEKNKKDVIENGDSFLQDMKDKTFEILNKKEGKDKESKLKYNYMSEKLITKANGKEGSKDSISDLNNFVADLLTYSDKKEQLDSDIVRKLYERYHIIKKEDSRNDTPYDRVLMNNRGGIFKDPQAAYIMMLASSTSCLMTTINKMDKDVEIDDESFGILSGIRAMTGFAAHVIACRKEFNDKLKVYNYEVIQEDEQKLENVFTEASKGFSYVQQYKDAVMNRLRSQLYGGDIESLKKEMATINDKLAARTQIIGMYVEMHDKMYAAELPMLVERAIKKLEGKLSSEMLDDEVWQDVDKKLEEYNSKSATEGRSKTGAVRSFEKVLKTLGVDLEEEKEATIYQKRKDQLTGALKITNAKWIKELWQSKKIQEAILESKSDAEYKEFIDKIAKNYSDNMSAVEDRLKTCGALGKEILRQRFGAYMGSAYLLGNTKQVTDEFDYYQKNFYRINPNMKGLDKKFASIMKEQNCGEKYWPHIANMVDRVYLQKDEYISVDTLSDIVAYTMKNVDANLTYLQKKYGKNAKKLIPSMWDELVRIAEENAYASTEYFNSTMENKIELLTIRARNKVAGYQMESSMNVQSLSTLTVASDNKKFNEINAKMNHMQELMRIDMPVSYSEWLMAKEKEKKPVEEVEEKGYVNKAQRMQEMIEKSKDPAMIELAKYIGIFNGKLLGIIERHMLDDKLEFMKTISSFEDLDNLSELEFDELCQMICGNARKVIVAMQDFDINQKQEVYEQMLDKMLLGELDNDYQTIEFTLDKVKKQSRHKRNMLRTRALIGMRLADKEPGEVQYDYLLLTNTDKNSKHYFPAERKERFANARMIWNELSTKGDALNVDLASEFRTIMMAKAFEFEKKYVKTGDDEYTILKEVDGVMVGTGKKTNAKEYYDEYKKYMNIFIKDMYELKPESLSKKYALNIQVAKEIREAFTASSKNMKNKPYLELMLCGEEEFLLGRGREGASEFVNGNDTEYQRKLIEMSHRTMKREEDLQKVINYRYPKNKDGVYTKEQLEARKSEYRKMRRNIFAIPEESEQATKVKSEALSYVTKIRDLMRAAFQTTGIKGLIEYEPYQEFIKMTSSEVILAGYGDMHSLVNNIFAKANTELLPYLKAAPDLVTRDEKVRIELQDYYAKLKAVLEPDMIYDITTKMATAWVNEENFYSDNRQMYGFTNYREALVYMDEYMNLPKEIREKEDKRIDYQMKAYEKNMRILESYENGSYAILKDILPNTEEFWDKAVQSSYEFKEYLKNRVSKVYSQFVQEADKYVKDGKEYLIDMYISQNMQMLAMAHTSITEVGFWKSDIAQFENDIFMKKIGKHSINERLASLKNKGKLSDEEERALRLGAAKSQAVLEKMVSTTFIENMLGDYRANLETAKKTDAFANDKSKERQKYMYEYAIPYMLTMDPAMFGQKVKEVAWFGFDSFNKMQATLNLKANMKKSEKNWMIQSKEDMLFNLRNAHEYRVNVQNETLALLKANRELELKGQTVISNIYGGLKEIKASDEAKFNDLINEVIEKTKVGNFPELERDIRQIAREVYFSNEFSKEVKGVEKKKDYIRKLVRGAIDTYLHASEDDEFKKLEKHGDSENDAKVRRAVIDRNCRKFVLFAVAMRKIPSELRPDYKDMAKEFWARQDAVNRIGKMQIADTELKQMALNEQEAAQVMMYTLRQGSAFLDRVNTIVNKLQGYMDIDGYVSEYMESHKEYKTLNKETKYAVKMAMREKVSSYVVDMESAMESQSQEEMKRVINETMSSEYLIEAALDYQKAAEKEKKTVDDKDMSVEQFDAVMVRNLGFFNRRKYKSLDENRKRLLALNIIMLSTEVSIGNNTMKLVHEGTEGSADTQNEIFEQMIRVLKRQDYLEGDKDSVVREKIDYARAAEAMKSLTSGGKALLFEQALERALFAEKRWDSEPVANMRILDNPDESIRVAKVSKRANKVAGIPDTIENDKDFKQKLVTILEKDDEAKLAKKIEKMTPVDIQLLITILQNRSVVDITTDAKRKGSVVNPALNRKIQHMVIGEKDDDYKKKAQIGSNCERAMRTLFSFQLRDDVRLNSGNINKDSVAKGALERTTAIDIKLLENAIAFKEKLDKLANSKATDATELNILADGFYTEMLADDKKNKHKEHMHSFAKEVIARYNVDKDVKVKDVDIFSDKSYDDVALELFNMGIEEEKKKAKEQEAKEFEEWKEMHEAHLAELDKIKLG